jgi:DNA ligase D-like protein (predicted 3'-phosphoesterase)
MRAYYGILGLLFLVIIAVLLVRGGMTMPRAKDSLKTYRQKRNTQRSPEPRGTASSKRAEKSDGIFVVQKHAASHLHYDFRLAIGGALVSWAIPKGPPRIAGIKRLAVRTEDHPMAYAHFEGTIPEGEYGAGTVIIWDTGTYSNIKKKKDGTAISMKECLKRGAIEVELHGEKLHGDYALVQMKKLANKDWLLMKMHKKR